MTPLSILNRRKQLGIAAATRGRGRRGVRVFHNILANRRRFSVPSRDSETGTSSSGAPDQRLAGRRRACQNPTKPVHHHGPFLKYSAPHNATQRRISTAVEFDRCLDAKCIGASDWNEATRRDDGRRVYGNRPGLAPAESRLATRWEQANGRQRLSEGSR